MRKAVLEGMSFCMVLLLGLCADGLAERPGGLVVLLVGMLLSGVPLILSQLWDFGHRRKRTGRTRRAGQIGQRWPIWGKRMPWVQAAHKRVWQIRKRLRIWGKKKAAGVVATPQRQVKRSNHATISRLHFTEA